MSPLDLQPLRRTASSSCAVHGGACPTGGGNFSRDLYEYLSDTVWPLVQTPAVSWEDWTTEQATRCRLVTGKEREHLELLRANEAEATIQAAEHARRWLAENGETDEPA